jgi:hypothetical protein
MPNKFEIGKTYLINNKVDFLVCKIEEAANSMMIETDNGCWRDGPEKEWVSHSNFCRMLEAGEITEKTAPDLLSHPLYPKEETKEAKPNEAIEFAKWLKHYDNSVTHFDPFTKTESQSIGFSPYDCFIDELYTVEELYEKFKQLNP